MTIISIKKTKLRQSIKKAARGIIKIIPLLAGVVLLTSLISKAIPSSFYASVLGRGFLADALLGNILGSIAAGNPVTSYILGGELLAQGVSLIAVTAFLVAWVTVGVAQLPFEAKVLSSKFALIRNLLSFIFVLIVAGLTVALVNLI